MYNVAIGVNDPNVAAGSILTANGVDSQACYWDSAGIHLLPYPEGRTSARVNRLNDSGQMVGMLHNRLSGGMVDELPCLWDSQGAHVLDLFAGDTEGWANDIDSQGTIVGISGGKACLWDGSGIHLLPLPTGGTGGQALAINDKGLIVGNVKVPMPQACVWYGNDVVMLGNLPGCTYGTASAVNENGWIIGSCVGPTGNLATLWVPVPEFSSLIGVVAGLGMLGAAIGRRGSKRRATS